MKNHYDISIIIPAYNSEDTIGNCIVSVLRQNTNGFSIELIVVDDCSEDNSIEVVTEIAKKYSTEIKILKCHENSGPGFARDLGIQDASGKWILLLDSDDTIKEGSLVKLYSYLKNIGGGVDIVALDWEYSDSDVSVNKNLAFFKHDDKERFLKNYLSLKMDSHEFGILFRNDFLKKYSIKHNKGYHEDILFLFLVYYYADTISISDIAVVKKFNRKNSIINTISTKHIIDFFKAYNDILLFIKNHGEESKYFVSTYIGIMGLIATRIRFVFLLSEDRNAQKELLQCVYNEYNEIQKFFNEEDKVDLKTKYFFIAKYFLEIFSKGVNDETFQSFNKFYEDIKNKMWSCIYIQNALFLRPDEIRTCCKRFFVNNEMKGDVTLFKTKNVNDLTGEIISSKKELFRKINSAEPSPCDYCPYLEFKNWDSLSELKVKSISFEYHSLCNLRCSYCCDTYYGAQRPDYDVSGLFKNLIDKKSLQDCSSVVYAGGEPLLEHSFDDLITLGTQYIRGAVHRILTNALIYSDNIEKLIKEGKVHITTSLDAGFEETWLKIRCAGKLENALRNLEKYAKANASSVTIKYIFIPSVNDSVKEIREFVKKVKEYNLSDTNIQISYDFNKEEISIKSFAAILALYAMLVEINCKLVFFDDLIWQRFPILNDVEVQVIIGELKKLGFCDIIADKSKYSEVVIWGAGEQAKRLVEKSNFFKKVNIAYFIDDYNPDAIGKEFLNRRIEHPDKLLESDLPIIISAVQAYPFIFRKCEKMDIAKSRFIEKIII